MTMIAPLPEMMRDGVYDLTHFTQEIGRRKAQRLFYRLFPDHDSPTPDWARDMIDNDIIYARDKYPKHLAFFEAGKTYPEICFRAANRTGKTLSGAYQGAAHLTGEYPHWWNGRTFTRPIRMWAAGKTNETTRDILQTALLGPVIYIGKIKTFAGTGLIPGHAIRGATWKQGVPDLADVVRIKHQPTGRVSLLGFKSYNQGRGSFEGTAQHVILLDEEPPEDVYGECLIRTTTTKGIIMLTFTPLNGISAVVRDFLPISEKPEGME